MIKLGYEKDKKLEIIKCVRTNDPDPRTRDKYLMLAKDGNFIILDREELDRIIEIRKTL